MSDFKVGDVVFLAAPGSPAMSVQRVYHSDHTYTGLVACEWFTTAGEYQHQDFEASRLLPAICVTETAWISE